MTKGDLIDKVNSNKNKPYSGKNEKSCVKITEEERDNLRSVIREREIARRESSDYYYFFLFFFFLLLITLIILYLL